jgi:hypothetical protein
VAVTWKKVAFEDDAILRSTVTTKGDILYATASATLTRLGIGTDGFILNRDTATDVPKWIDPAGLATAHHVSTHIHSGDDIVYMDNLAAGAAVGFAGQQATNLVIHTVANAGARPTAVVGKACIQSDTLALYFCTAT